MLKKSLKNIIFLLVKVYQQTCLYIHVPIIDTEENIMSRSMVDFDKPTREL